MKPINKSITACTGTDPAVVAAAAVTMMATPAPAMAAVVASMMPNAAVMHGRAMDHGRRTRSMAAYSNMADVVADVVATILPAMMAMMTVMAA